VFQSEQCLQREHGVHRLQGGDPPADGEGLSGMLYTLLVETGDLYSAWPPFVSPFRNDFLEHGRFECASPLGTDPRAVLVAHPPEG